MTMEIKINRLDFIMMKLLNKNKCVNAYEGMTLAEILEVTGTCRTRTYMRMMNLIKMGYVKKGCKAASADTFYLTAKGINFVKNKGENEGEIEE